MKYLKLTPKRKLSAITKHRNIRLIAMKSITTEKGEVLLVEVSDSFMPNCISNSFLNYSIRGMITFAPMYMELPPEGYDTILGEITKDGPQFDCHELVKSSPDNSGWINYMGPTKYFDYAAFSFVSLLNSQGVYLVFPDHLTPKYSDYSYPPDGPTERQLDSIDLDMQGRYEKIKESTLKEGHKYIAILKIR